MKKKKNEITEIELPFDDIDFINKWQEWLEFRSQRRVAKYVPIGLKGTFTRLKNISGNDPKIAIQIIQRSMDNNWQGLFELPQNYSNGKTGNTNNGHQNLSNDKLKDAILRTAGGWQAP